MISKNMTQKGYTVLDPVHIPERVGEARETKADNNKIRTTLGWEPTTTIEEWLSKYHYTFSYN
jgi:nucleoside-diphosphate-sugar epimerase